MKRQFEFLKSTTWIAFTILPLVSFQISMAQQNGTQITLIAEQQKPRKEVSFVLNQMMSYKTVDSKKFTNGRLKEITDSTVSFEDKELKIVIVRHKDLIAFKIQGSGMLIDFRRPLANYNLQRVSVKLKSGKRIYGKLISIKGDSIAVQTSLKKPLVLVSYSDVESVGMHKKGSGGMGVLFGALGGGGIGAIIGLASRPEHDPTGLGGLATPAGAIFGFVIGVPIGAGVGSSNKQHIIQADKEKFHLLEEEINSKKLWTLRVNKGLSKN